MPRVSQRGLKESQRLAEITESSSLKDKRIAELEAKHEAWEKERKDMRRELRRAQKEAVTLKD